MCESADGRAATVLGNGLVSFRRMFCVKRSEYIYRYAIISIPSYKFTFRPLNGVSYRMARNDRGNCTDLEYQYVDYRLSKNQRSADLIATGLFLHGTLQF